MCLAASFLVAELAGAFIERSSMGWVVRHPLALLIQNAKIGAAIGYPSIADPLK